MTVDEMLIEDPKKIEADGPTRYADKDAAKKGVEYLRQIIGWQDIC